MLYYLLFANINTEVSDILIFFKKEKGDYLKRVQMLVQLMYFDSLANSKLKKQLPKKSIILTEYYINNPKEYLFELNSILNKMHNELIDLS